MSGRIARQYRERKARLAAIPPCECGAGVHEDPEVITWQAHQMDCPQLVALGRLSARGFCSHCGARLRVKVCGWWRRVWLVGCPHRPPCLTSSRWVCEKRTDVEDAIRRGVFSREDGARLMLKYGVALTAASKVFTGARPVAVQKRLL